MPQQSTDYVTPATRYIVTQYIGAERTDVIVFKGPITYKEFRKILIDSESGEAAVLGDVVFTNYGARADVVLLAGEQGGRVSVPRLQERLRVCFELEQYEGPDVNRSSSQEGAR